MARKVAATTLAGGLVAAGIAAGLALADADRRSRMQRSARVWRLTARRGAHYAVVKVRGARKDAEARAALEQRFASARPRTSHASWQHEGRHHEGGQLISFIAEGLPPEAQAALATLQADVPPMAPSLAEGVIRSELGDEPSRFFLDWNPIPVAAASVGQVHKAVLPDGRMVAVKVQYPGIDRAIRSDLDNAEMLYSLFSSLALKGLDVKGLADELRARMFDELDYRIEAANQEEFWRRYTGHPFIRIPEVVRELSTQRVLVTEWIDGWTWAEFEGRRPCGDSAAEVLFRFAQARCTATVSQRRSSPRQLPVPCRRHDHLPRVRPGEALVGGGVGATVPVPRRDPRP